MPEVMSPDAVESKRRRALRAWMQRPAGLGWELACVVALFALTYWGLVAYRFPISRLNAVPYTSCCGIKPLVIPVEKHPHSDGASLGDAGAAPGPAASHPAQAY